MATRTRYITAVSCSFPVVLLLEPRPSPCSSDFVPAPVSGLQRPQRLGRRRFMYHMTVSRHELDLVSSEVVEMTSILEKFFFFLVGIHASEGRNPYCVKALDIQLYDTLLGICGFFILYRLSVFFSSRKYSQSCFLVLFSPSTMNAKHIMDRLQKPVMSVIK